MHKILPLSNWDYKKIILLLVILNITILNGVTVYAQQSIVVHGIVSSAENNMPLSGVSVIVQGSTTGTTTDADGKYSINATIGKTLTFSFLEYTSQNLVVNKQSTIINVALILAETSLEKVVVVGYGSERRATITGSVATIGSKEISKITSTNLVTGLAGKLPGLRVTQRTGEPGSYTTAFDIRGYGNPLIVVDGVVRNDFNRFDPNEIESITVLKDASAAIYGVKAANGVILVTTKKGAISKPVVTYSGSYQLVKPIQIPTSLTAADWATLTTEQEINSGVSPGSTTFTAEDIQKYKDGSDPVNFPSTNWVGLISKKYTTVNDHNINISGGTDRIKYFTSLGYMYESGIWKSNDLNYRKYNFRSSITGKITDNLSAQMNIDGIFEHKNEPKYAAWNLYLTALNVYPNLPVYANNNPQYLQDVTYPDNPLGDSRADYSGYRKTTTKTFQGNFSLDYKSKAIDGLTAKAMISFYSTDKYIKAYNKYLPEYGYDQATNTYNIVNIQNNPATLTGEYTPFKRTTVLGQITYDKSFSKKHNVKASLAFEERHENNDDLWAQKEFLIDVDQFYAGIPDNAQVSSGNIYENDNQNVIGRLNYNYLSKYIFESGFNYGGSSNFPAATRWGFFPYVSVGWRISEEPFIKHKLPFVTNLKLRGSWGKTGDDGSAAFQYITGYSYPNGNYVFNNTIIPTLGFSNMPNPNITWITATSKNIGVDLGLYSDLVTMQFDVFQRDRSGLLGTRVLSLPGTVGANLPQENLNSDRQIGFELQLGNRGKIGKLNYNISGNVSYTRQKNLHVERAPDGNSYLNWINNTQERWGNIQWGYKYIGHFQTEKEVLSSPIQDNQGNTTLRPGSLKYEDVNRDGIINSLDIVPIGRGNLPNVNFGLNINLSWRNFDMSIFAQGAAQFEYTYGEPLYNNPLQWGRNSLIQFMDRWHHQDLFDPNSPWIPGRYPSTGYLPSDMWPSAFWRQDASYIRLKNVELGYNLGNSLLKKTSIQNVRVYASVFNLFTLTKIKYVDPEQDPNNWGNWYPITKTITFGLNVTF